MPYAELFGWWIATITWSIGFPIAVSIYLYYASRKGAARAPSRFGWVGDFAFVWFLLGLLVFYIVAVARGSPVLFGLGNVAVEGLLIAYVVRAGRRGQTSTREQGPSTELAADQAVGLRKASERVLE